MYRRLISARRPLLITVLVLLMLIVSASSALAQGPPFTHVTVIPPRTDPPPIPHTDVLDPSVTLEYLNQNIRPESLMAYAISVDQGTMGEPGVLDTITSVANGLYLYPNNEVCNDFNFEDDWVGVTWTNHYAGWGSFAADDGYYQAKNVTFDREQVIGPGNDFGDNSASMKVASNQPYDAGVMSPQFAVSPGDEVVVIVRYLIYNHDNYDGANFDYASIGIIPGPGELGEYALGYQRGEWATMEKTVIATGDSIQIMLQGYSPYALNSNIYFDDVEIHVNGAPMTNCKG